jgi:hypothetical protein
MKIVENMPSRARSRSPEILQRSAVNKATQRVTDDSVGEGNLVSVKTPAFVTICGLPANETGFKVVRQDATKPAATPSQTNPTGAATVKPIVRRTRRNDAQPILALTFPAGTTQEEVTEALSTYGLQGYTLQQDADAGVFRAIRADLQSIANAGDTMTIKMNEAGLTATVQRTAALAAATTPKSHLTLSSIEFDSSKFDETQVNDWLARNSVDSKIAENENSANAFVVRRSSVPENEETRQMTLEDGVTATIVRSDVNGVPDGFYAVVNETAYGSWGWGHLDFAASLADAAFSEAVRDGIDRLDEVLRNILYWSPLPLDVRKTLANNALTQFGEYIGAIMDSLPRQFLVSVVRSAQPQLENRMNQANSGGTNTTATSTPAATVATTAAPAAAPAAAAPAATLTRAEADAEIAAATAKAEDALLAGLGLQRKAPEAKPEAAVGLTRADLAAVVGEALAPLAQRMEKLEGTTVVNPPAEANVTRSAQTDAEKKAALEASKKDGSIFRGTLIPQMVAGRRNMQ